MLRKRCCGRSVGRCIQRKSSTTPPRRGGSFRRARHPITAYRWQYGLTFKRTVHDRVFGWLDKVHSTADFGCVSRINCVLDKQCRPHASQNIRSRNLRHASEEGFRDAKPFRIQWLSANGLARPTIPICRVALIALFAMKVRVNPRAILAFVLLGGFVCSRPIALG